VTRVKQYFQPTKKFWWRSSII